MICNSGDQRVCGAQSICVLNNLLFNATAQSAPVTAGVWVPVADDQISNRCFDCISDMRIPSSGLQPKATLLTGASIGWTGIVKSRFRESSRDVFALKQEVSRLNAALKHTTEERDILKNAAVYSMGQRAIL